MRNLRDRCRTCNVAVPLSPSYCRCLVLVIGMICVAWGQATPVLVESVAPDKPVSQYVRVVKNDDGQPTALQTSIHSYRLADREDVSVDLVGAIHVGETAYYAELNKRFREYDAVLYELVAPEGTRVPAGGGKSASILSSLQDGMTQALDLAFQLECIDYMAKNFVHADMTPTEFAASMRSRDESWGKMIFRSMGQSLAQQANSSQQASNGELLAALLAENRTLRLRRALAKQFADLDGATLVFTGPDGSTLITERNKKALRVLDKQLLRGKKRLAIFFGAGHMQDLAARLAGESGWMHTSTQWLDAWDLSSMPARDR